jgi:malic enzyme
MFIVAAKAVAEQVNEESLATGLIYPSQSKLRETSPHVAARVTSAFPTRAWLVCRARTTSQRISGPAPTSGDTSRCARDRASSWQRRG